MTVHICNFDKDIKIEGKNFYMPSGKLKVGSTAHVEVTKKKQLLMITNNIKKICKYLEQIIIMDWWEYVDQKYIKYI